MEPEICHVTKAQLLRTWANIKTVWLEIKLCSIALVKEVLSVPGVLYLNAWPYLVYWAALILTKYDYAKVSFLEAWRYLDSVISSTIGILRGPVRRCCIVMAGPFCLIFVLNFVGFMYLVTQNYTAAEDEILSGLCSIPLPARIRTPICENFDAHHSRLLLQQPPADISESIFNANGRLLAVNTLNGTDELYLQTLMQRTIPNTLHCLLHNLNYSNLPVDDHNTLIATSAELLDHHESCARTCEEHEDLTRQSTKDSYEDLGLMTLNLMMHSNRAYKVDFYKDLAISGKWAWFANSSMVYLPRSTAQVQAARDPEIHNLKQIQNLVLAVGSQVYGQLALAGIFGHPFQSLHFFRPIFCLH